MLPVPCMALPRRAPTFPTRAQKMDMDGVIRQADPDQTTHGSVPCRLLPSTHHAWARLLGISGVPPPCTQPASPHHTTLPLICLRLRALFSPPFSFLGYRI